MSLRVPAIIILLLSFFQCASDSGATGHEAGGNPTFESFDGQQISYRDGGDGPAVMLLHGFINDGSSWLQTQLYGQLVNSGYRVIIPDMRGNGFSAKPHTDEAYANDAEVKDLMILADELELDSYIAIGYSRGSIVLAKLLTEDKRISRAVLGGMGVDFTDPDWPRRKQFAAAFAGETTPETEGAVEYAKSVNADLKALHLLQKHQPVTSLDQLRSIDVPVLVAVGSSDKDNGDPGALERLFRHGKLAMMPGDHNNTYKTPVFAAAVMAFVKAGSN
ncbi:alpha/beta hydrolase [Neolewinella aurantiaca]|uniref:Alpha/beta hydrolase n=1 Tax=Neolewinella aurantiaca TaxID=2602767 RepID=A0A5C7FNB5_9BACT|nr:alpha/beta hydrolase [Neolewinella aurantiaca]TXF91705.1 alpha/beta hydrolase [Neolewinella aurantiaca]